MRIWRSLTGLGIAAIILFCVTAGWTAAHAAQSGTATVRAIPPSASIAKSDNTFEIKIDAENVTNLGGFQFVLVVDSSILRPTSALKTGFLGQSGREIFCPDATIEDAAIRYACVTLREQPAGVDGSGTLATVNLKTIATGLTDLTLKQVKLVHPDGTELASTTEDARLSVTGASWWTRTHVLWVAAGGIIALLVAVAIMLGLRHRVAERTVPESGTDVGA